MDDHYSFLINGHEINFPSDVQLLSKLGTIGNQFLKNPVYIVKSKVQENHFKLFIDYLFGHIDLPTINAENLYDFLLLSHEFEKEDLQKYFKKSEFDEIYKLTILHAIKSNQIHDKTNFEEFVAQNLDVFLLSYENGMRDIPIPSLYKIFYHPKRNLNNQEKAYQFISKIANDEKENKQNICVLFESLDASKISEESFNDSMSKKDKHYGFTPKYNISFIGSFNRSVAESQTQILNHFENYIQKVLIQQNQSLDTMKQEFTGEIKALNDKIDLISRENDATKRQLDQLSSKIDDTQNSIQQISQQNTTIQINYQNIVDQQQNSFNEIKNLINDKFDQDLSIKITDIQSRIGELSNKNDATKTQLDQLAKTVGDTQNLVQQISQQNTTTLNNYQNIVDQQQNSYNEIKNLINDKFDQDLSIKITDIHTKIDNFSGENDATKRKLDQNIETINNSIQQSTNDYQNITTKVNEVKTLLQQISPKINFDHNIMNFNAFQPKSDVFDGIFNFLQTYSNIKNEINITASSCLGGDLYNLLQYENKENCFYTTDSPNSWICFEFKNYKIIPSNYIIRSYKYNDHWHLKSWVVEGSNDNQSWIKLDEQQNNNFLKGPSRVHLFSISNNDFNQRKFKYIRIQQTGLNWFSSPTHNMILNSIEFYGKII